MNNEFKGPRFVRYAKPVIEALQALGGSGKAQEVKDLVAEMMNLTASVTS